MLCFMDTSALYAVLDRDDRNHGSARDAWTGLLSDDADLITSSYVLVETIALLQNRLGLDAVHVFREDVFPVMNVHWVDEHLHEAGLAAVMGARRRGLSLVDCVSFTLMRKRGIRHAFAFDSHFAEQGFEVVQEWKGQN